MRTFQHLPYWASLANQPAEKLGTCQHRLGRVGAVHVHLALSFPTVCLSALSFCPYRLLRPKKRSFSPRAQTLEIIASR
jgi:hypothetical protein